MPDKLTHDTLVITTARSRNMAAIRAKDTKPEIIFLEHHKVKRYAMPEENDYAMVAEDRTEYGINK